MPEQNPDGYWNAWVGEHGPELVPLSKDSRIRRLEMEYKVKTTAAKAWVAAIGTTLTALTTALAAVSLALSDDALDMNEISALVTAGITAGATIYGVWRTENKPKAPTS